MIFFIISLIAGFLTVLTPCVLPMLPIVLGSSVIEGKPDRKRPFTVIASLIVSVFIFTFLLRISTALINVSPQFWTYLSGAIIFVFGLSLVWPSLWSKFSASLFAKSNTLLNESYKQRNKWWGDIALGAALGPIFTTCSPTFFVILATVLPASLTQGVIYLVAYSLGLAVALLLIAFLGQKILLKFSALSDPKSNFKQILGWIFIILAVLIATGFIKKAETKILDAGFLDFTKIEKSITEFLLGEEKVVEVRDQMGEENLETNTTEVMKKEDNTTTEKKILDLSWKRSLGKYKEIVNPSDFVNTGGEPIKIADYVGEKVILLDIMTYSCINCQRTFPYVTLWYENYKDDGLIIIGIHTPEFAFEKKKENVEAAMKEFGINFPVVMDNDYDTWNAYGNRYWPRKYLIDIKGNIVYDHVGEGQYAETEKRIKDLLIERAQVLGEGDMTDETLVAESIGEYQLTAKSPETYFGSLRNSLLGNGPAGWSGESDFDLPAVTLKNTLYLGGNWSIGPESAEAKGDSSKVIYKYHARKVHIVASSDTSASIEVYQDGKLVKTVSVKESKLYTLIDDPSSSEHLLELRVSPGIALFAFTFG